ncbi:aldo/keto reductase [Oenococcus sicerae]|uniref:Aldo/keto reductase n=1 Tax=Oenococcus sicerae TaxID=2203724 RepID=A0AAJ1R9T6_9LACO|nr:aldo/keto reductase [Oenococcus sicerae]MDN6900392.1 aldo/keto reductase [Oenococcus sicerae]QAS69969.1 aldo/keto reductase [Oenococcus sicerae]
MSILDETFELNNQTKIPKLAFGTWRLKDGDEAYNAVASALKIGYRHVDTAFHYFNEKSVGQAIKDSGLKRDQVFLTTKLPAEIKNHDDILKNFQESLDNLQTDYVDLYLIHAPWPWSDINLDYRYDGANQEAWRTMEEIYQSGRAKAIGVSNFDVHDLKNLEKIWSVKPAVNQIEFYVGWTQPKIVSYSKLLGIQLEAYSPLATGGLATQAEIQNIAEKYRVSVPQTALKYVLQKGILPLPRATKAEHAKSNADLNFEISADDMTILDHIPDTGQARHNVTMG